MKITQYIRPLVETGKSFLEGVSRLSMKQAAFFFFREAKMRDSGMLTYAEPYNLRQQAVERRLKVLLAYHQKLFHENKNRKQMDKCARTIRRLLVIYEARAYWKKTDYQLGKVA